MPPKAPPKIYQLLVKTHTLTIFLTIEPKTTIASLKTEILSALNADVHHVEDVPQISDEADFEISQAVKGKNKQSVQYEVLEETATVMNTMTNWEVLFIQFKDPSGKLLPVKVTQPSLLEDEEEDLPRSRPVPSTDEAPPLNKGKRKAPDE